MTLIRIDPIQLDEMASLLDAAAGELDAFGASLTSADLGGMPSNVAGAVGNAYGAVRSALTGLASGFAGEATDLRFRSALAYQDGGLGTQLGVLGWAYASPGAGGSFLDVTLGLGACCCYLGGAVVGGSIVTDDDDDELDLGAYIAALGGSSAIGAAWSADAFTVGGYGSSTWASLDTSLGAYSYASSASSLVGGSGPDFGADAGSTWFATGGGGLPGYSDAIGGTLVTGGSGLPGYSDATGGTLMTGGGGLPGYSDPTGGTLMTGGGGLPGLSDGTNSTLVLGGGGLPGLSQGGSGTIYTGGTVEYGRQVETVSEGNALANQIILDQIRRGSDPPVGFGLFGSQPSLVSLGDITSTSDWAAGSPTLGGVGWTFRTGTGWTEVLSF